MASSSTKIIPQPPPSTPPLSDKKQNAPPPIDTDAWAVMQNDPPDSPSAFSSNGASKRGSTTSKSKQKMVSKEVSASDKRGIEAAANVKPTAWQHFRHHQYKLLKNLAAPSPSSLMDESKKKRKRSKKIPRHGTAASKISHDNIHLTLDNEQACIGVSISPEGKYIGVALLGSTTVKPLSHFSKKVHSPVQTSKKRKVTTVDIHSKFMATGHADGCLMIHNMFGEFITQCSKNPGKILSCSISTDGTMVCYGGSGYDDNPKRGWFRILDATNGELLYAMKSGVSRNDEWTLDETIDKDEQKRSRSKSSVNLHGKSGTSSKSTSSKRARAQPKRKSTFLGSLGVSGKKKTIQNKWMKAKRNVLGVMMAVNRQPAPNYDSSLRCCKLSAPIRHGNHRTAPCLLATGGRGKHVVIWEVPHFIHKKKKKKKTGPFRALQILFKFPIQSWCTCMCFSEDASFFGYGTTDGRLRLHETSNGSQFQHFQPTDLTAPKVQADGSKDVGLVTKQRANDDKASLGGGFSNQARVAQITLLVDDDLPQGAPTYNDDIVVYVLEQKVEGKRWASYVLVRDVISAAILHTYCVSGAQSSVALWASPTCVVVVARPTRVRGRELIMHVHDLDAGMRWQSIRHGDGAASKTAITACCLSEDGEYVAIADATEKVTVYNSEDGAAIIAYSQGAKVQVVVFSPSTKYLACGGYDKKNGRKITGLLIMRKIDPERIGSSPIQKNRKSTSPKASDSREWANLDTSSSCWERQHPGPVADVTFCEGGKWLAVADGGDGDHVYLDSSSKNPNDPNKSFTSNHKKTPPERSSSVKIYKTSNGDLLQELDFAGRAHQVDAQRYSISGECLLACVGEGGLVNLWATTPDGIESFENVTSRIDHHDNDHQHHCTVVSFSPDGHYFATGDEEGEVILREFVQHTRKDPKDPTKMVTSLEIRSINHNWESPGPISGVFFIDDGHGISPTIMVFCYWDRENEYFRTRFIQLNAPMYPDHEWWGASVAASGGRTSVNMKSRCGVIVVESLVDGHITLMNLTDTVPLPSEMPTTGKDCGAWISCCPYLVHRQDRLKKGETILHILCGQKDTAPLKSYLDAVGKVAPIVDDNERTPLDVAMYNNDYVKVSLLLRAYIEWSATGLLALKLPLKKMAKQYPNLITKYLNRCYVQVDCKFKRMAVSRPIVSHSNTLQSPWLGTEKNSSVLRPVDAFVIGFSGFMDSDGPYEAIVEYGELPAFDTDSLQRVIQFKWQAYGFSIYCGLSMLHFFITCAFSMAQVSTAVFPNWKDVQVTPEGAGVYWIIAHCVVAICVLPFLFFEGREASREGFCNYAKDSSNYLELLNSFGVMSPIPYYYVTRKTVPEVFTSFLILTTWLRVLTYLRAFELTGSLMRMVTAIVLKMRVFMLIMAVLGTGYMAAFSVLFPNLLQFRGQRMRILINFFEAMLGEPMMTKLIADPINVRLEKNMTETEYLEYEISETEKWQASGVYVKVMFGQVLLILFYLLVVIVMLNLLIAIMGNAYDEIAQNEAVEMQRARATAILYIERNILSGFMKQWKSYFPRYLHVCRPHQGGEHMEETSNTAEARIEKHFNLKMKEMENQMLAMKSQMDQQLRGIMTLMGAGVLIERKDHPHKLRRVGYKNWARTIPMWRCSGCSTDYSAIDRQLMSTEPPVYVCDDAYHQLMMDSNPEAEWTPAHGCDFALCNKCIRNQEPLPSANKKKKAVMKDRQIERAEQMALQESKEEEAALDSLLVEEEVEEMSAEDMFAMLEADNEDATTSETKEGGGDDQSADDLYAMLND